MRQPTHTHRYTEHAQTPFQPCEHIHSEPATQRHRTHRIQLRTRRFFLRIYGVARPLCHMRGMLRVDQTRTVIIFSE